MLEFLSKWGFAVLGLALLVVAFLVNRVAPRKRRRIRGALGLYVLFVVLNGTEHLLLHARVPAVAAWAEHAHLVGGLLAAFTCVELATMATFDVLLPTLGFPVLGLASDVLVAFAYAFAGFGVLKAAGITGSSVLTTSAVVSGILALSMQATLGNIVGGVALQLDGSFHVGEWLQLPDGTQGKVTTIRWRHTVLETRNWDTIIVPNANLLAQNIVILGKRTDKPVQHRMWVYFNVDFRFPPSHVIDVVREALWAAPIEGIAEDPRPSVICYDFAKDGRDAFAYYAARYWLTDLPNDDPTSSRVRTRIYSALKRAAIPLARHAQTVFVTPEEQDRERRERHKENRVHVLEQLEFLGSLTPEERQFAADHLMYAPFTAGETVTKQDAVAHWLYILCAGKVEVRRRAEGSPTAKVVATIDAPGFFGEMGMLMGVPRRADVVALTDVECYRLDKEGLQRILTERPEIAAQISRTLAKRDVEMATIVEGLDEETRRARLATTETRILGKIQEFFGLSGTSIG